MLISILLMLMLTYSTNGLQIYQTLIPNGEVVPDNCDTTSPIWSGVGHVNKIGSGTKNYFGTAFKNANDTWTTELCRADSDGDGRTNGAELGDPLCIWSYNATPTCTTGLSHPGRKDKFLSTSCTDGGLSCTCNAKCSSARILIKLAMFLIIPAIAFVMCNTA